VVRHVADQVGVMYLGRLVELADKRALFGARATRTRACCSTRSPTST
jgi:ABC-type oligopeptide transport system ATPase subunit